MTNLQTSQDVISAIKEAGGPIAIFGAGIVGELLLHVCRDAGVDVQCFIDNNIGLSGKEKYGVPIMLPAKFKEQIPDAHIIVSAADIGDIISQFNGLGYTKIYPASPLLRTADYAAYQLSADYDFIDFAAGTCMQCHDAYVDSERIFMRSVDIVITERCSMKCQDCSNLMQYYEKPDNCDTDEALRSIDLFFQSVDGVNEFRVIGGEPFMNKEIHLTLKHLINEPKVRRIVIYTNGTILPKPEHIEYLQDKKILMLITDYGPLSRNMEKLLALLDSHKINYFRRPADHWTQCSKIGHHGRSVEAQKAVFSNCCAKNLFTLMGGKLYRCPFNANADRLKAIPDFTGDYVNLFEVTDQNQRREAIRRFLFDTTYLEACDYCDGRFLSAPQIEPAIQVKAPLPYQKMQ